MTFTVTLKSRSPKPSKRFPLKITLDQSSPTVGDLKLEIEQTSPLRLSRHRQRITTTDKKSVLEDDEKSLESYGIKNGEELVFKDLGPQVGQSQIISSLRVPSLLY
jgi:very-long-chain enoyl-CoA reductase